MSEINAPLPPPPPRGLLVMSEKVFIKGQTISAEKWLRQESQLLSTEAADGQAAETGALGAGPFNVWNNNPFLQAGSGTQLSSVFST